MLIYLDSFDFLDDILEEIDDRQNHVKHDKKEIDTY
jgi:hypothetical protein